MAKGTIHRPESQTRTDPASGCLIRQITSHPSLHHHPFYYIPAYDDAMRWLVFVSHRTGHPQIFAESREEGVLIQLTDREDLNEWSIHPSHDGHYVYFTAGTSAWRVRLGTGFTEECLASFETKSLSEAGMVGAAMGTTTLSRDDRWWAVPVKYGSHSRFMLIETGSGDTDVILERDTIGHPQFHPDDNRWLRYAGPYHSRIWVLQRDGSDHRLVYERKPREWIVHETWVPGTREILTTNWPHGVFTLQVDTGKVRPVTSFPAWHPMVDRPGHRMVADTKNPDTGLKWFDLKDPEGRPHDLCWSGATNVGDHWNTDHCPYDDGPIKVHAPQHTHPHPNFSPDGRHVVFTSDATGHSQVCEATL